MFSEFSNGYYFSKYWVTENKETSTINEKEYDIIKNNIYSTNTTPIIMKIGSMHFEVRGSANTPSKTIQLSNEILEHINIDRIPTKQPVFLAKPKFAKQIINMYSM